MKEVKILLNIIFLKISVISICYGQNYSRMWKDLNYAEDTMKYHLMDIYLPTIEKNKYPVVIAIYGSAWLSNNLKESVMPFIGKYLLDNGFAVVAPNHRSSKDAKFPAQIHDIKAVIRFVRANANKYLLDTNFIGITGFSSGGHLASLAGASGNIKQISIADINFDIEGNVGPYLDYSSKVDAVVDWFGPINLTNIDSCRHQKMFDENNAPEVLLMGMPIANNKNLYSLANPVTYLDKNDPPFLIIHGDKDDLVPYCQSEYFYKELLKNNVKAEYILVSGAGHGPGLFEDKYLSLMIEFFKQSQRKK